MTRLRRQQFALSVAVLALAAGLRLWHISQTPPGLYLDEAFHLLRAQEIAHGEAFPIFITGNNGNEPLFVYLSALTLMILGPVTWAGRLVAAWAGIIGVALTIRAGHAFFPKRPVGILAGLILATLFWSLTFSRFGIQPMLATPAAAGALAALWHGARTDDRRAYALAGLCVGLGLNAYVAFRLFPVVMLGAGLALLIMQREKRFKLLAGGLLVGGTAVLIFAPLGLFFIQNPGWFFNRFDETTATTLSSNNPGSILVVNTIKTLGGLFIEGDNNWRHNLAGRPALDAAQAVFFLIGIGVCLRQWRKPEALTLLIWLVVGLSPSAITFQAPHFGRTTLVLPAITLLVAVGITTAWEWTRRRVVHGLIAAAVVLSIALTLRDFWGRWAYDPSLFEAFEVQQEWIARALQTAPANSALYATPLHIGYYHHLWPLEYILGPEAYRRFSSFNGLVCSVLPAQTTAGAAYVVIVPDEQNIPAALEAAFPTATHRTVATLDGQPYLELYQIPPGQTAQVTATTPHRADFGGLARLIGYTLTPEAPKPGGQIQLKVIWEAEQTSPITYKIFVHLIGPPQANGSIVYSQHDAQPCMDTYPTQQWHLGELVVETYSLPLPANLPLGDYTLQTGWYNEETGVRVPVSEASGQPVGNALKLETIHISLP